MFDTHCVGQESLRGGCGGGVFRRLDAIDPAGHELEETRRRDSIIRTSRRSPGQGWRWAEYQLMRWRIIFNAIRWPRRRNNVLK